MDEKSFLLDQIDSQRIIIRTGFANHDWQRREYDNRELATVLKYISADDSYIRITAILKDTVAAATIVLTTIYTKSGKFPIS